MPVRPQYPETSDDESRAKPQSQRSMRRNSTVPYTMGISDPTLSASVSEVINALRAGILPPAAISGLLKSLPDTSRRDFLTKHTGLNSSVLDTVQTQVTLIDRILKNTFNDDGTISDRADAIGMEPKDVLNACLKVSQIMSKDLPKIYTMKRITEMEQALFKVIDKHMTPEQRDEFIDELEKVRYGD